MTSKNIAVINLFFNLIGIALSILALAMVGVTGSGSFWNILTVIFCILGGALGTLALPTHWRNFRRISGQ